MKMDRTLEIRKLPPVALFRLVQILELGQAWKQLMAIIPKSHDCSEPKYKVEHISGRKRPDVALLLDLLVKAHLFRAADYVAIELLKEGPPARPDEGPAALVDVSAEALEVLMPKMQLNQFDLNSDSALGYVSKVPSNSYAPDKLNLSTDLPHFEYNQLLEATSGFLEEPFIKMLETAEMQVSGKLYGNGRKLGTGAFGSVYLGYLAVPPSTESKIAVAVKRLNKDAINLDLQFRNEVEMLSKFQHTNLLPLIGYSCDGPLYCLVYEYMSNGSLQEKLAYKDDAFILTWIQRIKIAEEIAQGIVYLHTAWPKPLIHRDIKSANILLDHQLIPKLGDFGLVRLSTSSMQSGSAFQGQDKQSSALLTTTVLGTSAYMAPEAFRGDISVKLDTFSFGVVLLELLTSLPPYDTEREGCDLVTHVEEICVEGKIAPLLDSQAGDWGCNSNAAQNLYQVTMECLEEKRKRPKMVDVLEQLEKIVLENVSKE
ncbi:hypothetical protein J437_LFUL018739 [Ladona fulva]|uniref:non-specific serine/threonine protein kinase n=1 Tax=Ladona fulva TaxID=123851 RepID=A0A8K0PD85_LADFU|nr:hypothetical protein J437_LFUL018739 [Ladona fulva]